MFTCLCKKRYKESCCTWSVRCDDATWHHRIFIYLGWVLSCFCHALPSAVSTVSGEHSCVDLLAGSWGLVPLLQGLSGLAAAPALPLQERKYNTKALKWITILESLFMLFYNKFVLVQKIWQCPCFDHVHIHIHNRTTKYTITCSGLFFTYFSVVLKLFKTCKCSLIQIIHFSYSFYKETNCKRVSVKLPRLKNSKRLCLYLTWIWSRIEMRRVSIHRKSSMNK